MPIIDTNYSTLTQIRTKVRRLTRSPSVAQLTDQQIDDYVNTFVLYDFPQHLRIFTLKKTLTFYTSPNVDTYRNNTVNEDDPLYNFINKYTSIHPPLFIMGNQCLLFQDKEPFYNLYPKNIIAQQIATGDGTTSAFSGTLSYFPVLPESITISSISAANEALILVDTPNYDPVSGLQLSTGTLDAPNNPGLGLGTINYVTGVYNLIMPDIPAQGKAVNFQAMAYTASKPYAVLFYDNKFVFRPVPDQPYKVELNAFMRPTELLNANSIPELAQWWQYIAYGASKKVFEDRLDQESIQAIMPEYKQQELLVLRSTIMQLSNERADGMKLVPMDGDFGYKWYGS